MYWCYNEDFNDYNHFYIRINCVNIKCDKWLKNSSENKFCNNLKLCEMCLKLMQNLTDPLMLESELI